MLVEELETKAEIGLWEREFPYLLLSFGYAKIVSTLA